MKIVILGAAGQLGSEFRALLREEEVYAFSREELDVAEGEKLLAVFTELKPEVVLNCAAYTRVDQAEDEPEMCYRVNALGARNVAYASYRVGAKVVYISSDYVFSGDRTTPYTEFDRPCPLSVYGKSKFWGEIFTRDGNPNHLIIRTSWLYGKSGHNFVKTVIKLAKEQSTLRIVDDQRGTPTWAKNLAEQTLKLLRHDRVGIYHAASLGETTWFHFARAILQELHLEVPVVPITTGEYDARAARPCYSVLRNYVLEMEGLNVMPEWSEALREFLSRHGRELLHG